MSRSLNAPRWGSSAVVAGAITLALTVLLASGPVPRANAAFTTGKCAGENITGRGASFARDAHKLFNDNFKLFYCSGTPGAGKINVTYEAQGSGAGRTSVKVRNDTPRFGMTDEPPTPAEIIEMNSGIAGTPPVVDSDPSNDGSIHVVPAAVGAVAPLVNFPNGCDVNALPVGSKTAEQNLDGDATPDDVVRVRFSKAQFESIWEKEAASDQWHEVFPALAGDTDCEKPIIRVVRFDDSGTSFAFKDYLDRVDPAEGWLTTYAPSSGPKTREWPNATFGDRDDCGDKDGVAEASDPDGPGAPGLAGDTDQLMSACFNGNQGIVDTMVATDGSIGYSDISTARKNTTSFAIAPETDDNDLYWTQIPNGSGAFEEPTADANGFRTVDGSGAAVPTGSNCSLTTFKNVPATTKGNWAPVSGVDSAAGYAICTLTYGLVFDDNADVWGNTPAEESKARTVKDYWENALTEAAQSSLLKNDYAPLPVTIRDIARKGIAEVDWNKGSGGGGSGGGGGGSTGGGGGNTTTPPPPPPPSNRFSLPRKTISSKTGRATISVKLPGPGKVVLLGTAKSGKKQVKVGQVVLNAGKAGTFALTLKPSGAAMGLLNRKGSLPVSLKVTYTPTGGSANTAGSSVTLKLTKQGSGGRR